jgi:lysophospholipase L1-like esterase
MKTAIALVLSTVAVIASAHSAQAPTPTAPRPPHIVLVGDSTVTEGSGWGRGFRQLVAPEVRVINTAQNGRSSKSFRDEGHWATALAARGDYYLIQFGHNDQPGKGPERETDPATFPANMARYVDEVRAIGATPILVTSLVRRTFSETEPAKLTSTLGPWVEAVKRVAAEKRVPLIDLDASSRALCERLGPVEAARFNLRTEAGAWDTTHLDAAGSIVFARLVADELRRVVPALAAAFREEQAAVVADEPTDLPPPFPLLAGTVRSKPEERTLAMGRVYTRALRLDRYAMRMRHQGREPDVAALPPLVTSPAILVAWDYVPQQPPPGAVCEFAEGAPSRVLINLPGDVPNHVRRDIQPLTVTFDRARIRELLAPYEADSARVRWIAVLDPARLRAPSFLRWEPTAMCPDAPGTGPMTTGALIDASDVAGWLAPSAPAR